MTANLSPILSNDSAANSVDEATPIVVRTYEAPDSKHIDPEEQRHLMIARAGTGRSLSDSSNSSSDLASELGDVEQSSRLPNVAHNQAARQSSASSSSASSTIAGGYLFIGQTARNNTRPMTTRAKICEFMRQFLIKLKQAILSIPLVVPLTISIIFVVSTFFVMFSDNRYLISPTNKVPGGVAQPLVMGPSVDPLAASLAAAIAAGAAASEVAGRAERGDSLDGDQRQRHHNHDQQDELLNRLGLEESPQAILSHPHGTSTHHNHRQLLQKMHQPPKGKELSTPAVERLFNFQQLQLKNQLIGDLLRSPHSPQSKRQSMSSTGFAEQQVEQQQPRQQPEQAANPTLESIREMLINSRPNGATTNEETPPAAPAGLAGSIDAAGNTGRELEAGAIDSRPALLRSSTLELDLDEHGPPRHHQNQNVQHQNHHHQQQQQHSQYPQPATKLNYRQPAAPPTSPVQQPNHIQQAYRANEERARLFPNINNHDRPFDVPQIQCNITEEGFDRFACPTPDSYGRYRCIEDRLFCDGYYDCPGGEDEEGLACMYYRLFVSHLDVLTNTFLSWMKKQNRFQSLSEWETPGD